MASTTFSFEGDDSGSEHEHWPEDFAKPAQPAAVASAGYDSRNGLRMHTYHPASSAAPSTIAHSPSPPPSPEAKSVKAVPLTNLPFQYAYVPPNLPAPKPVKMSTHAYVPAPAPAEEPKPAKAVPNTYTYHPTFSEKPAETTNKWQGRTKAEVEEDNQKIAADEKVWEKRKVVPTGLADDQMCWVVEADGAYTLR